MKFSVKELDPGYDFDVTGVSFIGEPKDGTVLFVAGKLRNRLKDLKGIERCLVFVDEGVEIPEELKEKNCFITAPDAMIAYGRFAMELEKREQEERASRKYTLAPGGFYIGKNVSIGEGTVIEPCCLIDHDVTIGKDCRIGFGTVIRHAEIGDRFRCGAHTQIGTPSFFPAGEGEEGIRIPSFGRVVIMDDTEMGGNVIIERGFNTDTVIGSHVMFDAGVCIGHDDRIGNGVWVLCGSCLGGFVTVGDDAYIGMNATVKQRLSIGERARVGMGSVVITRVKADTNVFGSPAERT